MLYIMLYYILNIFLVSNVSLYLSIYVYICTLTRETKKNSLYNVIIYINNHKD